MVLNNVRRGGIRSQSTEESESRLDNEVGHKEEAANQDSATLAAAIEAINPEERTSETHSDRTSSFSSHSPEIQRFEVEPKIAKALIKIHKNELDDIEAKPNLEIPKQPKGKKFSLKPKKDCSAENYNEACNLFIDLYQKMYQLVKMERFSLKSEKTVVRSREEIAKAGKKFPIWIEVSKDRKQWEMYGEASHIEEALKYLEQEGLEIKRETEMSMDDGGRN